MIFQNTGTLKDHECVGRLLMGGLTLCGAVTLIIKKIEGTELLVKTA
jgi:hypothetical protein